MNKMTQTAAFKAKLATMTDDQKNQLLHFLPESESIKVREMAQFDMGLINSMPIFAYLGKIHPSWFESLFNNYSKQDKLIIISAFTQRRETLADSCHLPHDFVPLSNMAKQFVLTNLYKSMLANNQNSLPFPFLSVEPFFNLLTLPYEKVSTLIDLMGMHDLAPEMKTLIRSQQVRSILEAFHPKVVTYLKQIATHDKDVSFGKLGISSWNGNVENLKELVHKRGLNRIARVVSENTKSYQNHLMYLLSKQEALILKSFFSKKKNEEVVNSLKQQLNEAIDFLLENFQD
ncbi:MAG: hypothetical protein P0S95_02565 [Rhabdochlamydiaceae bacterium]|nr:hypothetical protein [Candidatus Amphrikana amoebophyrae]